MASTIKDIAKQTGLGLATISKYLNGGNVKEKNRIAIEDAIKTLDFTVNEFARGLKTSRSKIIGVVIPELSNVFITSIITVVEDILRGHGYGVIVCDCRTDEKLERDAVQFLIGKMVDGIINMPVCQSGSHLAPAIEKGLPILLIDRMIDKLRGKVSAILVDNVAASKTATLHLLERGHKKIGIILGPKEIFTSRQRLLGFEQAYAERGFAPDTPLVRYSDYTVQGGYEAIKSLLSPQNEMTAVFITNYEMTLGAVIAINELGIKILYELSLIGFDNLQLSQIVSPKLTIVTQPLSQIGESAANIILAQLSGEETGSQEIILTAGLQIGQSVSICITD